MVSKPQLVTFRQPLTLQSKAVLPEFTLAYETYGRLNAARDNVILILHALSGDSHVASHFEGDTDGWWEEAVGSKRIFDTDRYFVVCANVLGGCQGSTGPGSINPQTGRRYGLDFPIVTVGDIVESQRVLMDFLGIDKILAVVGGSMGGMQALQWAVSHPDRIRNAIILASTARVSPQTIALDEVARQAIYADPNWRKGNYYDGEPPNKGLAVARMIGHITYLSDTSMHDKFGRRLQERPQYGYDFETDFAVESYLRYRGNAFTNRFDANAYLYITKAIDYFDMSAGLPSLADAFNDVRARFLIVSFSSDWLFPPSQSRELVRALLQRGVDATYTEIQSDYGHDAFLLEVDLLKGLTRDFLENQASKPSQTLTTNTH
jgi:homoserine O-acetyltransferase/O-succinyltransferase